MSDYVTIVEQPSGSTGALGDHTYIILDSSAVQDSGAEGGGEVVTEIMVQVVPMEQGQEAQEVRWRQNKMLFFAAPKYLLKKFLQFPD